jgi:peptide/nickel transport system permease protein
MINYLLRRLVIALMVAVTVSALAFALLNVAGDPARSLAGEGASQEAVTALRAKYGLDRPLPVQYFGWLGKAVTGDFGNSIYFDASVSSLLAIRVPVTAELGALALLFAVSTALPLGLMAALKPNSIWDRISLTAALFGQAMPNFWFSLLLIMLFGVRLGWLPISGSERLANFVMPAIALGYYAAPAFMRLIRAEMIEVLDSDYIRTARAKGLSETAIVLRHALRNAVIPVVSLAAVQFGFMLGGSVIIETIFAIEGLGALAWESISRGDFPVVQATVFVISIFYIGLTLVADVLNAAIDPRLRLS